MWGLEWQRPPVFFLYFLLAELSVFLFCLRPRPPAMLPLPLQSASTSTVGLQNPKVPSSNSRRSSGPGFLKLWVTTPYCGREKFSNRKRFQKLCDQNWIQDQMCGRDKTLVAILPCVTSHGFTHTTCMYTLYCLCRYTNHAMPRKGA